MRPKRAQWAPKTGCLRPPGREGAATMRYTTTDGPDEPLNAIKDGSLGDKMGIADGEITCRPIDYPSFKNAAISGQDY